MLRRILALVVMLPVLACADGTSLVPTAPPPAALNASTCDLGVTNAAARIKIAALVGAVDALEMAGDLTSGRASALRWPLTHALRQIDARNHCAARAQLQAFEERVGRFLVDGVLALGQGEARILTTTQVIHGPTNLVTVDPPSAAAGVYEAGYATFGPTPTVRGTVGTIVLVDDGSAVSDRGCNPLIGFPAGAIALVKRGACTFVEKVLHAQAAGAIAVIVQSDIDDGSTTPLNIGAASGTSLSVTVPVVAVTLAAGEAIRAALPAAGTVTTYRSRAGSHAWRWPGAAE